MFRPQYRYTHALVERLLRVESARSAIDVLPLAKNAAEELRVQVQSARLEAAKRLDGTVPAGFVEAAAIAARPSADCPDERELEELRAALTARRASGYRTSTKLVYDKTHSELIYIPPEAEEVPRLIGELFDWLDESWDALPAVILAGISHQELLLIHPYEERNNAIARLAGQQILARKGYGFGGYAAIEATFAEHLPGFEEASRSVHSGVHSSQADFTTWLEHFAGEMALAGLNARDEVQSLFSGPAPREPAALPDGPVPLRDRQVAMLQYIRENGAIRSGEYQRLASIVPDTARRDFDELMGKGLIEVRGVGRGTHYVLTTRGVDEAERRRSR